MSATSWLRLRRPSAVQRARFASARAVGFTGRVQESPRLEVEAERSELEVRRHLQQQVIRVIRDPDLRAAVLREDSLCLDRGADDERVEPARGNFDRIATQDFELNGI